MIILSLCCTLSCLLLIWFKSTALEEYSRLLRVPLAPKMTEYLESLKDNGNYEKKNTVMGVTLGNKKYSTYLEFLQYYYYDKFIVSLVSCPICLSFWIGCLLGLFNWPMFWPIISMGGLVGYLLVEKLWPKS